MLRRSRRPGQWQPQLLHCGGASVAQLDRASGFEPEGREFESLRARHIFLRYRPVIQGPRTEGRMTQAPHPRLVVPSDRLR